MQLLIIQFKIKIFLIILNCIINNLMEYITLRLDSTNEVEKW